MVPSASTREQVVRLGLPRERVEVVRHYLPADAFGDRSGAGRGGYALVTARLSEEKGVDVAIRAAALTGVPLRVAGDGPQRPDLERLAGELRAPVEFLGRADRASLAALLRRAAVVLVPSRFHETAGYAAMEAMAAGVPVLASRSAPCRRRWGRSAACRWATPTRWPHGWASSGRGPSFATRRAGC